MNAIESSVTQLQALFTIVMALAITEGLKQFVKEIKDDEKPPVKHLRWRCSLGLFAFLVTVMPFTYGMSRYFFEAYRRGVLAGAYFDHLLFDSLMFTIEALCFFVMSRSLSVQRSLTFAGAVLLAFVVDIGVVVKCHYFGLPSGIHLQAHWIVQDPIVAGLLIGIIVARCCWKKFDDRALYVAACGILIAEAVVDLSVNWTFYFPTTDFVHQVTKNASKRTIYLAGPLFTQAEWNWNVSMAEALRQRGFDVIVPQERATKMLEGSEPFNPAVLFRANINGIEHCDVVLAVLDGADADSGTAWECGYAYRIGRPVVGVRTDLRVGGDDPKAPVNLMLAQTCRRFIILPLAKRGDEGWLVEEVVKALREGSQN